MYTAVRQRAPVPPPPATRQVRLQLLHAFSLEIDGRVIDLALSAQRLIAFLALRPHALQRSFMAGYLWLDASDERAAANLRSALWRLRHQGGPIVVPAHGTLRLDPAVVVDVHDASHLARRWLGGSATDEDLRRGTAALEAELLPDWYDDWVVDERERFRQLRLHGLEAMSTHLVAAGRLGDALLAALAAVTADPLRETAHRALINVYLAEGNLGEAVRQLRRCKRLFHDELGVSPSALLADLVQDRGPVARGAD